MPEDKIKHPSSADDSNLFSQLMGDVTPLKTNKINLENQKAKPKPIRQRFPAVAKSVHTLDFFSDQIDSDEALFFARPGLQHKLLRQFKRGALTIEDSLDLHGLNKVQAQQLLEVFLIQQCERQHRCFIVIHGKGIGSSSKQPILKNLVFSQLKNDTRVLAFCSAQPRDGCTGAVYVLLKKATLHGIDDQ